MPLRAVLLVASVDNLQASLSYVSEAPWKESRRGWTTGAEFAVDQFSGCHWRTENKSTGEKLDRILY